MTQRYAFFCLVPLLLLALLVVVKSFSHAPPERSLAQLAKNPYRSPRLAGDSEYQSFVESLSTKGSEKEPDLFWEQVRHEARLVLKDEEQAGPLLYQGVLSHSSLLSAIITVISHEIENELIVATEFKSLFLSLLTKEDVYDIRMDLEAVASRSPSVETALDAVLFHNGFHALVCYRAAHRLWKAERIGLAHLMQSIVSSKYQADIHPACRIGYGCYLRVGAGVVIGETAIVGNDVSILEAVTLGGTGKESGDRHPKIGNGVILQQGGTVLGNIKVGDGAIVGARSIVTKPVPPLGVAQGVPAKIVGYRSLDPNDLCMTDLEEHLLNKYVEEWKKIQTGE